VAYSYRIDLELGVVQAELIGVLDDEAFIALFTEVLHHPDYRVGMKSLLDFRRVTQFDLTGQGIRTLAGMVVSRLNSHAVPWQTALVAPQDVAYGLSRMYQILREGSMSQVEVFREFSEAWRWLGLPEDEIPA